MLTIKDKIDRLLKEHMSDKIYRFYQGLGFPDIWERPASSSGNYHQKADGSITSCGDHALSMMKAAVKIQRMFTISLDTVLLAIAIHDALKYGDDGKREKGDYHHPYLMADYIEENLRMFEHVLGSRETFILEQAVRYHMGRWSKQKLSIVADVDEFTYYLHMLDMMETNNVFAD
jgi:hypothetical protein